MVGGADNTMHPLQKDPGFKSPEQMMSDRHVKPWSKNRVLFLQNAAGLESEMETWGPLECMRRAASPPLPAQETDKSAASSAAMLVESPPSFAMIYELQSSSRFRAQKVTMTPAQDASSSLVPNLRTVHIC